MEPLRIASVAYLNARPLTAGLEADPRVRLAAAPPSGVADQLARGEVEVALLPVIELARIPGVTALPDWGIAARGRVDSVLAVCRVPLPRIATLAPDPASRTSNALVEILLRDCLNNRRYKVVAPGADADGRVLIGDEALRRTHGPVEGFPVDLAALWHAFRKQPFVFAVWAVAPHAAARAAEAADVLEAAARKGMAQRNAIAREAAPSLGLPVEVLTTYLTERIQYKLGKAERAAVTDFLELSAKHHLAPAVSREVFSAT